MRAVNMIQDSLMCKFIFHLLIYCIVLESESKTGSTCYSFLEPALLECPPMESYTRLTPLFLSLVEN